MRCFEVINASVRPGIRVKDGHIWLGESGRGRELVRVPVIGVGEERILSADLERNPLGAPVIRAGKEDENDTALVWCWSEHGFRGTGRITGPAMMARCEAGHKEALGTWKSELVWRARGKKCPLCGSRSEAKYLPLDHRIVILATGRVADGAAGRMAHSFQYLLSLPKGAVWGGLRTGRLYGKPGRFFYWYDGEEVRAVTSAAAQELQPPSELVKGKYVGPNPLSDIGKMAKVLAEVDERKLETLIIEVRTRDGLTMATQYQIEDIWRRVRKGEDPDEVAMSESWMAYRIEELARAARTILVLI